VPFRGTRPRTGGTPHSCPYAPSPSAATRQRETRSYVGERTERHRAPRARPKTMGEVGFVDAQLHPTGQGLRRPTRGNVNLAQEARVCSALNPLQQLARLRTGDRCPSNAMLARCRLVGSRRKME
jgi:hypothetical protein